MRTSHNPDRGGGPQPGLVEWFHPGEHQRAEAVLAKARALGIREMRTGICWADWCTSEDDGWYAWLLPRLAADVSILPCFLFTPPSLGIAPKFSSPPRTPKAYADFIDVMITRFGEFFEWVESWNHPNDPAAWDSRMDPGWRIFRQMISGDAYWIHKRGKKAVLPGLRPSNLEWFELMHQRGVLSHVDVVGVHAFPSSSEFRWRGWEQEIHDVQQCLTRLGVNPQIWITQSGFSTWRGDEQAQVRAFADAMSAPVERVYWQEMFDRPAATARFVHLQSGVSKKRVLITGGAGFVGTNLADRLLGEGHEVTIYDNLSRRGVEQNVTWLRAKHGKKVCVEIADIRDISRLKSAVRSADHVFHFAAQVAVTTSLREPRNDYEVNIGGTVNLLEAIRSVDNPPSLVFTSTNKVYGALSDLGLEKNCTRYQPLDAALQTGISEERPLDFHSPYGCSKGAADQYVLDYARTFGIPAVVFRMSCIYGPHQMGTEDQGWIAHFLIQAMKGESITICGDGMQVRDVLFIDDLVDAFLLAQANSRTLSGEAFNIGGGLGNTISLIELLDLIGAFQNRKPEIRTENWRVGDQRYYVSDTRKFKAATGWAARVSVREGVHRLYQWLLEGCHVDAFQSERGARLAVLAH